MKFTPNETHSTWYTEVDPEDEALGRNMYSSQELNKLETMGSLNRDGLINYPLYESNTCGSNTSYLSSTNFFLFDYDRGPKFTSNSIWTTLHHAVYEKIDIMLKILAETAFSPLLDTMMVDIDAANDLYPP